MKKIVSIIISVLALSLVITGCSKSTETENTDLSSVKSASSTANSQSSSDNSEKELSIAKKDSNSETRPSSTDGKPQFSKANLIGEVTSISGNEVVLEIVEMPAHDKTTPPKAGQEPPEAPNGEAPSEPPSGEAPSKQDDSAQRGNPPVQIQDALNYTGESKTILIPDGLSVTTLERGKNNEEQSTVELEDIQQGNILQIWYSDEDEETISKIAVMSFMKKQDDTE